MTDSELNEVVMQASDTASNCVSLAAEVRRLREVAAFHSMQEAIANEMSGVTQLRAERDELLAGYRELRAVLKEAGGCDCGECLERVNAVLAKWGER